MVWYWNHVQGKLKKEHVEIIRLIYLLIDNNKSVLNCCFGVSLPKLPKACTSYGFVSMCIVSIWSTQSTYLRSVCSCVCRYKIPQFVYSICWIIKRLAKRALCERWSVNMLMDFDIVWSLCSLSTHLIKYLWVRGLFEVHETKNHVGPSFLRNCVLYIIPSFTSNVKT